MDILDMLKNAKHEYQSKVAEFDARYRKGVITLNEYQSGCNQALNEYNVACGDIAWNIQ